MLKEVSYIELSGVKFPMKMDNLILQQIQEIYGSIKTFEMLLMGYEEREQGIVQAKEPSIAVANFILPKMIIEGYAVLEQELEYTEIEIVRLIDKSYYQIATEIHEELKRCFKIKKLEPSQTRKREKKSRLTLIGCILSACQEWVLQRKK